MANNAGEVEILIGRRVFAVAQALFAGSPIEPPVALQVGWHDSTVQVEDGSFAVVSPTFDELVGEIVVVRFGPRQVFAYVLQTGDVPVDLSLTRRAFVGLDLLTSEAITAMVAPVE